MHVWFQTLSRFREALLIKPHFLSLATKGLCLTSQTKIISISQDGHLVMSQQFWPTPASAQRGWTPFILSRRAASSCLDFPFILHFFSVPLKMGMQYSSSHQKEEDGATTPWLRLWEVVLSTVQCSWHLKARFEVCMEWWFVSLTICFTNLLFQLLNQILSFSYIYSKFLVHSGGWKPHAVKTIEGTVTAQT